MTTPASDAPVASSAGPLNVAVQAHAGAQLRALYGDPTADLMLQDLRQLISRVAQVIRAHTEPVNQAYIDAIVRSLSSLRAFAISLTKVRDRAEDLVQDTVLRGHQQAGEVRGRYKSSSLALHDPAQQLLLDPAEAPARG